MQEISKKNMPTYHFTDGNHTEGIVEIETEHKAGAFKRAQCYSTLPGNPKQYPTLLIKDAGGSLILADVVGSKSGRLSKIHIGRLLIRNPHVEVYREGGAEGPRVDLHEVDLRFARERLAELLSWRDPSHREALMRRYTTTPVCNWYSTPHRIKQLKISKDGLEGRIREMYELVASLAEKPDSTFVSDNTYTLEEMSTNLVRVINDKVRAAEIDQKILPKSRAEQQKPKIIVAPETLFQACQIYHLLTAVLSYIARNAKVEESEQYWRKIDEWEKM